MPITKRQTTVDAYHNLVEHLAGFAYPITSEIDLDDYLDDFFGVSETQVLDEYLNQDQEEFFWEWLWYDLPFVEGKTIVETYIVEHEEKLSRKETEYLLGMQKSYRSCLQILEVLKGRGIKVRDLFLDREYFVTEVKGTKLFEIGDIIYARLIFLKNRVVFSGSCSKIENFDEAKIRRDFNIEYKLNAPDMPIAEFLKKHGGILYQVLFEV